MDKFKIEVYDCSDVPWYPYVIYLDREILISADESKHNIWKSPN